MEKITVYIKELNNREVPIKVSRYDTINYGKSLYVDGNKKTWRFDGKVLLDNETFDSYGIDDEDIINSSAKVKGGLIK